MVFYRSCPKCKGDMDTKRDLYGGFKECLQCGLLQDLVQDQRQRVGGSTNPGNKRDTKKKGQAA